MHLRHLLLCLMMLPALLLPNSLAFHLCMCDGMRAAVAERSCCAAEALPVQSCCEEAPAIEGPDGHTAARIVAGCSSCTSVSLAHAPAKQVDSAQSQWFVDVLLFVAVSRALAVDRPRVECTRVTAHTQSLCPPGESRSLPLLI